jgi:DNA-binding MarR family transcriptional regulator
MDVSRNLFVEEYGRKNPDFDADALIDAVSIHRMERTIMSHMDRYMSRWRVTVSTMWVLINLLGEEIESMSPAQLATATGLSRPSMTAALDSLEKKGYVRRSMHPTDRRMVSVHITEQGRSFMGETFPPVGRGVIRTLKYLTREERETFMKLYEKILVGARELLEEPA